MGFVQVENTISLQIVMYVGRPVPELLKIKQILHSAKPLLSLHLYVFKEYVCKYKHFSHRNGQSMEDCCYDVPGVVYGNARHQTRLCCNNMVEGKQAGSQGNGTGKFGVLRQVQTLV